MVNGVKSGRQIEETKTGDVLTRDGTNEMVMKSQESSFSGMEFGIGRLENVEKQVAREVNL